MSKIKNKQILVNSPFDFNSQRLISLATPIENNDAVTKGYADLADQSLATAIEAIDSTGVLIAISSLENAIESVESTRLSGDESLTTRISIEEVTRDSSDDSLESGISIESSTRLSSDTSLESAISVEESSRISGDDSLESAINNIDQSSLENAISVESSTRLSADDSLTTRLSIEESTSLSSDTSLEGSISVEESSRISGDDSLTTRLSIEESTSLSSDTSLESEISTESSVRLSQVESLEVAIGGNQDASLATAISIESSTRLSSDESLTTRLSIEESTRLSSDTSLASEIDDLTGDIELVVNSLEGAITGETSSRISGDESLTTRLSIEESTSLSSDNSLATRLSIEESTRLSSDTSLEGSVSVEESSRISGDESLESAISTEILEHKHDKLYQPDGTNPFVYTDNGGSLHIDGNILQRGSTYETHAEQIYTTKNYIILRSGATGGMAAGEYAGFEAYLYDGVNNGRLVFDSGGTARVGDVSAEMPIVIRPESNTITDGQYAVWDSGTTGLKFIDLDVSQMIEDAAGSGLTYESADGTLNVSVDDSTIKIVSDQLRSTLLYIQTGTTTIASGTTGLSTSLTLDYLPVGEVMVTINGIEYLVSHTANASSTNMPFYFNAYPPVATNTLYFNATEAGFGLDSEDIIVIKYNYVITT